MLLLVSLARRFDGARAIEPYEDLLIPMLDQGNRKAAIYLLGSVYPKPSVGALAALYAHLNDKKGTGEEFGMIAGSLLNSLATDPTIIHAVLVAARNRTEDGVEDDIVQAIGLARITNEEALAYVRAAFHHPPDRITAVQAIANMPKAIRDRFSSELQAVAEDPDERPGSRTAARQVLIQPLSYADLGKNLLG